MKLYKFVLVSNYEERFCVEIEASSSYEARKRLELDPGWTFEGYSVVGVAI